MPELRNLQSIKATLRFLGNLPSMRPLHHLVPQQLKPSSISSSKLQELVPLTESNHTLGPRDNSTWFTGSFEKTTRQCLSRTRSREETYA